MLHLSQTPHSDYALFVIGYIFCIHSFFVYMFSWMVLFYNGFYWFVSFKLYLQHEHPNPMEAIVEAVGPVASFTFFFLIENIYHIKFLSVICSTSSFDKQIICSTFNHVMIFTLIKIIFMLQIILKLWSPRMKFQDLKALPFNMLS